MTIERVRQEDADEVFRLLERNHLPLAGLGDHLATAIAAKEDGAIVGTAALEMYGDAALLRSVAVAEHRRGHGLGRQLTAAAIDLAKAHGLSAVYLLTTTAEQFFPKLGFERVTRDDVPPGVRTSLEFVSACPASAVVMRRRIARDDS